MSRARVKVFTINKSQAVRLPKAVELPAKVKEVTITAVGRSRVIAPAGGSWDVFFDLPKPTTPFVREQPKDQERKGSF